MSADSQAAHPHTNYVKIWAILVALLVVSVAGPFVGAATGLFVITLITAFGIAIVKASMVVRYFMHINLEKKYVAYLVGTMVILMLLMVGAVSPDVMHHDGANWHNQAAADAVKRGEALGERGAGHHEEHGGGEHGATPEHGAHE